MWMTNARVATFLLMASIPAHAMAMNDITRVGATAPQARALLNKISGLEAKVIRVTNERSIKHATLLAVLVKLGNQNPGASPNQILAWVDEYSEQIAIQNNNTLDLQRKLKDLAASSERDLALDLIARAQEAFDSGDLAQAEDLFEKLAVERWNAGGALDKAWIESIKQQANVAALTRGPIGAQIILQNARKRSEASQTVASWELEVAAALHWFWVGIRNGDVDALRTALDLQTSTLLPLVTREKFESEWAATHWHIGRSQKAIFERNGDEALLAESIKSLELAIAGYTSLNLPHAVAMMQIDRGASLMRLGELERNSKYFDLAEAAYLEAEDTYSAHPGTNHLRYAQVNLARLHVRRYDTSLDRKHLETALDLFYKILPENVADAAFDSVLIKHYYASMWSSFASATRKRAEITNDKGDFLKAEELYLKARTLVDPDQYKMTWSEIHSGICDVILESGGPLERALEACTIALGTLDPLTNKSDYQIALARLGSARFSAGLAKNDLKLMMLGLADRRSYAASLDRQLQPEKWVQAQLSVASMLTQIAASQSQLSYNTQALILYDSLYDIPFVTGNDKLSAEISSAHSLSLVTMAAMSQVGNGKFDTKMVKQAGKRLDKAIIYYERTSELDNLVKLLTARAVVAAFLGQAVDGCHYAQALTFISRAENVIQLNSANWGHKLGYLKETLQAVKSQIPPSSYAGGICKQSS